jgi:hypothetical protein
VAGVFGALNPVAAPGCGAVAAPVKSFFGFNNAWIWIILLLIFVLPRLGCGGFGGLGGLFGGFSWIWILVLIVFLVPGILPGFRLGGFGI